ERASCCASVAVNSIPSLGPRRARMVDQRTISSLLAELPGARLRQGDPNSAVSAIEHDSRRVTDGALFVAIPGFSMDGHRFLQPAHAAGAAAAIVASGRDSEWQSLDPALVVIEVPDPRAALSVAAAWFFGHPARELTTIGVTGTDGKTTT